jgi:hypothetical protein
MFSRGCGLPVRMSDPLTRSSCTGEPVVAEFTIIMPPCVPAPDTPAPKCTHAMNPDATTLPLAPEEDGNSTPPPIYMKLPSISMSREPPQAIAPLQVIVATISSDRNRRISQLYYLTWVSHLPS